jgi:hypothetical protein
LIILFSTGITVVAVVIYAFFRNVKSKPSHFDPRDPRGKHNTRRTGKSANEIDSRVERTDGRDSGRPDTSTNHYVNAAYIRPN